MIFRKLPKKPEIEQKNSTSSGGVKGDYDEKEKFRILLNKVRRSLFNDYIILD
ncbi:hypothetical protein U750_00610 [Streptococcus pseudopneumoniae G42]|nr:hypothetical protein U750_00610 [Streptococcus pseudopneumoniae G42]